MCNVLVDEVGNNRSFFSTIEEPAQEGLLISNKLPLLLQFHFQRLWKQFLIYNSNNSS